MEMPLRWSLVLVLLSRYDIRLLWSQVFGYFRSSIRYLSKATWWRYVINLNCCIYKSFVEAK